MDSSQGPKVEYFHFGLHELLGDHSLVMDLARFYCSIWSDDPHFGEYKKCPTCDKYYSKEDVEIKGVNNCSGVDTPHATTDLVIAWVPEVVADEELLGNANKYGEDFHGVYAIDTSTGKIIGFTWGWLESAEDIKTKWGPEISDSLGNSDATYYSEIAVDADEKYRSKKIGKALCHKLVTWLSISYPDTPSFLRTHQKSHARTMFQNVGYSYFAEDPQHGDGRIMMKTNKGSELCPNVTL